MKKSKILVPALGVLILSTAAAVSGTVAWFAATRSATVGVKNNTIVNPEGALQVSIAAGHNTTVNTAGDEVSITDGVKLRDASADITNAKPGSTDAGGVNPTLWRAHVDEQGNVTYFEQLTAYTDAYNSTDKVYYCATFTLTFTLEGSSTALFDVFFDSANSKYTIDTAADESHQDAIHNSYRLGMYSASESLVWAPKAADLQHIKYTNGTETTNLGEYDCRFNGTITSTSYATSALAQQDPAYLGSIVGKDAASGQKSLAVGCVIWFDGNDPQCKAENLAAGLISQATAKIAFNAIEQAEFHGA